MSLKLAKRDLRRTIKKALADVSTDSVSKQTQTVFKVLTELPEYQQAKRISIFLSMPGEISTSDIVQDAFKQSKKVFVPYIQTLPDKSSAMEMLALHSQKDYENLKPDSWGIPSIDAESVQSRENCLGQPESTNEDQIGVEGAESGLDLVVMPGLGFDAKLHRIGYGKGFYDKFLQRCYDNAISKGQQMPFLVALALQEQLVQEVPTDGADWPLDALIVGDGRYLKST